MRSARPALGLGPGRPLEIARPDQPAPPHPLTPSRSDRSHLLISSGCRRRLVATSSAASILHVEPLALRDGARLDDPAHRVRVERSGGEWLIWWTLHSRDTEMVCLLLDDEVPLAQFLERYEASRVTGFSYFLTLTKNLPCGILSVSGDRRTFRDASGAITSETALDRARMLVEEGGLSAAVVDRLPPDELDPNRPLMQAGG